METRLSGLTVWTNGDQRAPHKPLLLLLLFARIQRGDERLVSFTEVEQPLADLLREFGPVRRNYHPELPFWHLQSDGIWSLTNRAKALTPAGKISVRGLREVDVKGGLSPQLWKLLRDDPGALAEASSLLLEAHFPSTMHGDILDAIGLDVTPTPIIQKTAKRIRNPAFREKVLSAYDYRCAVCGLDVRLGHVPIAVEAAHIKWFQAGGPDEVNNGLALCVLHHKLLDRGAIAISPERLVLVSDRANGYGGFDEWVGAFRNAELRPPKRTEYSLAEDFMQWHVREVYHGES